MGAASGDLPEGQGPPLETGMSPRGGDPQEGQGFGQGAARGVCGGAVLTLCPASPMLRTKAVDSEVQERTVSVRPSRKSRVMEAS